MNHIVLSLDLECVQPSGHILEIGACIGDIRTGAVLNRFTQVVDPGEPVSEFITTLTGITNEEVARDGIALSLAYDKLIDFWKYPSTNTLHEVANGDKFYQIFQWGGGDTETLRRQVCAARGVQELQGWPFGRRTVDVKTLWQFRQLARGEKPQSGLSKSLNRAGLKFEGRKHRALDDSINTFRLAVLLFREASL